MAVLVDVIVLEDIPDTVGTILGRAVIDKSADLVDVFDGLEVDVGTTIPSNSRRPKPALKPGHDSVIFPGENDDNISNIIRRICSGLLKSF